MKLVTPKQMKEIDSQAIEKYNIPGLILMENAGLRTAEVIASMLPNKDSLVIIFAGKGNNGGDGFVIARHLTNKGYKVRIILMASQEELKGEAKVNCEIAQKIGLLVISYDEEIHSEVKNLAGQADLIVDAIYGTGFYGDVPEPVSYVIKTINETKKPVVAVDIPSGLDGENGQVANICVKANCTVTLGLPKTGLYFYPAPFYTGKIEIVDIGLPSFLTKAGNLNFNITTEDLVRSFIPHRLPTAHKGNCGKVLILGGSPGMTGAVALSCDAALKSGAGLVYAGIPKSLNPILEEKLTETITRPLPETKSGTLSLLAKGIILDMLADVDVLAIGPGLSRDSETGKLLFNLLPELKVPVVLDADALTLLAEDSTIWGKIKTSVIITPHLGEMSRLINKPIEEINKNKLKEALQTAENWDVITVLKGPPTVIACPDGRAYLNLTGNAGMATGGTGDVLTGIIAALIGQGVAHEEAAVAGTYYHGLVGDLVKFQKSEFGLTASDLVAQLPHIWPPH